MSSQNRVFLQLLGIVLVSVSIFGYSVVIYTKTAFEEIEAQREQVEIAQFKQQFVRFGEEVVRRIENIANADATTRMALDLARDKGNRSLYVHDAIATAQSQNLDFLEVTTWDGTIISSTPDYSRAGHNDSTSVKTEWSGSSAFVDKHLFRNGDALLMSAVRTIDVAGKRLYVNGGSRVDEKFLSSAVVPSNMRVLLYRNLRGSTFEPVDLLDRNGVVIESQRFVPLIQQVRTHKQPIKQTIRLTDEAASAETFFALPLSGRDNELLGIFLIGSSQREMILLTRRTEWFAIGFGTATLVVALPICFWCSLRVSRLQTTPPIKEVDPGDLPMKSTLSCVLSVVLLQANPLPAQTQSTAPQAKTDKQPSQQPEPISPPVKPPLAFGLDDGTPVRLRINRTISSEDARVGDTVDFEVLEDVMSHDVILIPRGGIALATITEAQSKRRMGRAGKLNVNIDNAKLVDGEKVALRAVKEVKGGSHVGAMTGAIVATSIVFFPAAPLFLFMKGKDITIPKGTEITAYINGDVPLDPKKFQPQDAAKTDSTTSSTPAVPSAENMVSTIELKSTPDGAEISIDGKYVGNTPTTLHLTVGDHAIKFDKPGFKSWERTLTITQGESTTIPATLEKIDAAPSQ